MGNNVSLSVNGVLLKQSFEFVILVRLKIAKALFVFLVELRLIAYVFAKL